MSSDKRAWGGRFSQDTDAAVEAMNASVAFDQALWLEDIAGSIAHSRMLAAQAIITGDEQAAIERGLVAIAAQIRAGEFHVDRGPGRRPHERRGRASRRHR